MVILVIGRENNTLGRFDVEHEARQFFGRLQLIAVPLHILNWICTDYTEVLEIFADLNLRRFPLNWSNHIHVKHASTSLDRVQIPTDYVSRLDHDRIGSGSSLVDDPSLYWCVRQPSLDYDRLRLGW